MNDIQFFILLVLAITFLTVLIFNVPDRLANFLKSDEEKAALSNMIKLQSELIAWKSRVSELERLLALERERNISLEFQVKKIEHDAMLLRVKLEELEVNVGSLEGSQLLTKQKATLLVMGDSAFGEEDRNALRRAGVLFHRLVGGGFIELREELQRKRQEGRQYKIIHISSHAGREGIQFSDEIVSGRKLSDILDGVELLFLASCSNINVADEVLGVVKEVVVVYEEIDSEQMQVFVYNFYNELKKDFDILKSFNKALELTPSVSEFVDLRRVIY